MVKPPASSAASIPGCSLADCFFRPAVAGLGPKALSLTDLTQPVIDWVAPAKGFGVPAFRARTDSEFADMLTRTFAEPGPGLIEAVLP